MCSSTWHKSRGNRKGVDSARGRLLRGTLSSKWNKDVMISFAGLNQKPFEIRYKASKIAYLLWTMCWSGNILDRNIWSINSMQCGSCLLNNIVLTVVSMERRRTISLVEGWGHCLYTAALARTNGRWRAVMMSEAQSVPGRPSMEKCRAVGLASRLDVIV